MNQPPPMSLPFEDVTQWIDSSRPVRRVNWFWPVVGSVILLLTISSFNGQTDSKPAAQVFVGVVAVGIFATSITLSIVRVRQIRVQQQVVEAVDEMMQLRRWEPASLLLARMLSAPARSVRLWAQALVQLSALLARHHRFQDAITVQSYLIANELLDDQGDYFLRLSRAMSMLREDHLVDADRAISDLRRRGPSQGTGGLALLEIFRDIRTGHPREAIDLFEKHLPKMQQQLGHRVADAHGLIAKAYDQLGMTEQARTAFERATLLSPPSELFRRYPELEPLAEKYPPAVAPREAV